MKGYYIICLEHTAKNAKYLTLWRPKNAGYCCSKEAAGVYEEYTKGYHDTGNNRPISVEEADKLFITAEYDGAVRQLIPNCQAVWDVIGATMTRNGLTFKTSTK